MDSHDTAHADTRDLVARLDAIRGETGAQWTPGWSGIDDPEAAEIIQELRSRGTVAARAARGALVTLRPAGCTCPDAPPPRDPAALAAWHEACAACPVLSDAIAAYHRAAAARVRLRAPRREVRL